MQIFDTVDLKNPSKQIQKEKRNVNKNLINNDLICHWIQGSQV